MPANVQLILGDTTGTPPTGNIVRLYAYWTGVSQVGEYPSDAQVDDELQIKKLKGLDSGVTYQRPATPLHDGKIVWEALDLDVFDVSGAMIYELKARRFVLTAQSYFIGASDMGGAYSLRENPLEIQIIDIITKFVPNTSNRKLYNVTMLFDVV